MKEEYSQSLIRYLLENYASLEVGVLPKDNEDVKVESHREKCPFELPVIYKCDLDMAMSLLSNKDGQKFVILALYIDGREGEWVAQALRCSYVDVYTLEQKAVKQMWRILNGIGKWGRSPQH